MSAKSIRSFGRITNKGILRRGLFDLGRRMLPDQNRAIGLLLAVELARLRQPHRAQVLCRVPGRHLPGGDDVHQRPDALAIACLTRPAHGYSTTFGTRKKWSSVAGAFLTMSSAMPPSVT